MSKEPRPSGRGFLEEVQLFSPSLLRLMKPNVLLDHIGCHFTARIVSLTRDVRDRRDERDGLNGEAWWFPNCVPRNRLFQFSKPLLRGAAEVALYCAHRTTLILLNDPSKLACYLFRDGG